MKTAILILTISILNILNCRLEEDTSNRGEKIRTFSDTIGYAHKEYQMDSVISRINHLYGRERRNILFIQDMPSQKNWKLVICPHDDYHYAGEIYPFVLENLKTPVIIIFGVAHKAKDFSVEDQLILHLERGGVHHWVELPELRLCGR